MSEGTNDNFAAGVGYYTMTQVRQILNNPSVSYWIKREYANSANRDCVDAYSDAQVLAMMLTARATHILNGGKD